MKKFILLCIATLMATLMWTPGNAQIYGETCDGPMVVPSLPYNHAGSRSLADYGNNYSGSDVPAEAPDGVFDGTGSTGYLDGYDAVYTYTPSSNEIITISTSLDIDGWNSLYVFTGCPFSTTMGYNSSTSGDSRIIEELPVTAGETYYIVVSNWDVGLDVEYTLNIQTVEACEGIPDAGIAAIDPEAGQSGSTANLTVTGYTEDAGISYLWETKDEEDNWVDAGLGSSDDMDVTFTGDQNYEFELRYAVTCSSSDETDYSNVVTYTIDNTDCVPQYSTGCSSSDYIAEFHLEGDNGTAIDRTDGDCEGDYVDNTAESIDLSGGNAYSADITAGTSGDRVTIWLIDDDSNATMITETSQASNYGSEIDLDIPASLDDGAYTMRVLLNYDYNGTTSPTPCDPDSSYGQTIDYTANVTAIEDCADANAGVLTTQDMGVCAEVAFTLEVEGDSDAADGLTKQWMSSTDGGTDWSAIDGATGSSYTVSNGITEETQYKYVVSCTHDNSEDETDVVTISLNPGSECYCEPEITTSSSGDYVSLVSSDEAVSDINYSADSHEADYIDETATVLEVFEGQEFTLNTTYIGGTQTIGIWVDWNNDGNFGGNDNPDERLVLSYGGSPRSFNVVTPNGIDNGEYRLRVRGSYGNKVLDGDDFSCNSQSYGTTVDFMLEIVDAPACPNTTGLTANNIGATAVDLDWDDNTTAMEWDVYVSEDSDAPDNSTSPTDPDVQRPLPYHKTTGLSPNTTYYFWVRADCDMYVADWAGPVSFTTACEATDLPFTQDFEGVTTPGIPNCASLETNNGDHNGDGWFTSNETSNGFSSNVLRHDYSSGGSPDMDDWYFTQGINLEVGVDYQISFKYGSNSSLEEKLKVAFGTSPASSAMNDPSNEIIDLTFEMSGSDEAEEIFQVQQNGVYYFGFQIHSGANQYYLYVDDIAIDVGPTCLKPTDLTVANITADSAELSWTTTANQSDIYVVEAGDPAPDESSTPTYSGETSPKTLDNLSANKTYDVYVRADCGGSDGVSEWAEPVSFSTACGTIDSLPYTENFDTYGTASNAFPPCWERPVTYTSGSVWPSIVSYYSAPSSPNSLKFRSEVGTPTYAVSPSFADDIQNLRVSFMLKREGTNSGTIDIGVMSDPFDDTTFELIQTIDPDDNNFNAYTFDLNTVQLTGGNNYIALRHNSDANNWFYWLDDFMVETIPSCPAPTDLALAGITETTADISWTLGDSETAWNISWGAPDYTPGDGDEIDTGSAAEESYQITGLTADTHYDVYIQADCGGDESVWVGPLAVFTGYCVPEGTNSGRYIDNFSTTGGSENITNIGSGFSADGYGDFTNMIVEQVQTEEVSFESTIVGGTAGFRIWVDWNQDGEFDTSEEVAYQSSGYSASHSGSFIVPEDALEGTTRMRIVSHYLSSSGDVDPCETGFTYGEFEDYAFEVIALDNCANVTAGTLTTQDRSVCAERTFTLEVTGDSDAADGLTKQWMSSTDGATWDAIAGATDSSYTVSDGIEEETQFKYVVSCTYDNSTDETGVVTISLNPGNECYCEPEITTTSAGDYVSLVSSVDAELNINYSANSHVADYIDETTMVLEVYEGQEIVLNTAYVGGQQTMGIWVDWDNDGNFGGVNNPDEHLALSYGTSPQPFPIVIPSSVDNGEYRLRVRGSYGNKVSDGDDFSCNSQSYGTTVDFTLKIVDAPSCLAPADLAVDNITEDSAELSWTSTNQNDVYVVETDEPAPEESSTPTDSGVLSPITLDNLTDNTAYEVYVRADCAGQDGVSTWKGPISFTTLATPPDNDSCDDSMVLECGVDPITVSSTGSTAESPDGCTLGDNGVWFSFVGTGGDITINSSADFDHKMSMQSGSCDDLAFIACKDGSVGDETYIIESSVEDEMYYVYVAHYRSYTSSTGDITISIECAEVPGPPAIDLNSAAEFGILAATGISSAAISVISNTNIGVNPGVRASITGFPPSEVINGSIYASDDSPEVQAMLAQAQLDLTAAYNFAAGASVPAPATISGDQGGLTLYPGIYKSTSTLLIQSGDLTLDAQGDPNARWIFQIASALTTIGGAGGNVVLAGGAQAKNITWQVGSSATIGNDTSFKGNILAYTSITFNTGSTSDGRLYAMNGLVALSGSIIIDQPCPAPLDLVASNITTQSADISWTEGSNETEWEVKYGPANFEPNGTAGNTVSVSIDPETTLNDLDSGTDYDVYIRAICDVVNEVEWSGPISFSTPCVTGTIPFNEGFEAGYTEGDALGGCWSQEEGEWLTRNQDDTYGRTARTGDSYITLRYSNEDWIFYPLELTGGTTYELSFYARQNATSGVDVMASFGTGNSAADMTTEIIPSTDVISDTYEEFSGNFTPASDGVYYIGIKGTTTITPWYLTIDDISVVEAQTSGYVYENGAWTPEDPNGVATSSDNITVIDGTASFTQDIEANDITVNSGATLNVEAVLTINGDITNNGDMVFKSTATSDGELAAVPNGSTITGDFTVERYTSDHRAYRFVSSAVSTTSTIHANWQEGATSASDNPSPGYGTHITGTNTDQQDGFDETLTSDPSMFTLNVATQDFDTVGNTDVNTLNAGDSYLLYVRGDRSIDLTSNDSHGSTVLRATGALHTGDMTQSFGSVASGNFVALANPYQSSVNVNTVISNSTNINDNFVHVFDPSLGTNGGYVMVILPSGDIDIGVLSDADNFIQPGQAVQVAASGAGATIIFNESDKAPGMHTTTFSNENPFVDNAHINGHLYTAVKYAAGEKMHDNFSILFNQSFDNALNNKDAIKPMNFTENMGIGTADAAYSLERRELPVEGENLALFNTNYENQDYTLVLEVSEFAGTTPYLVDTYTGGETALEAGENLYDFTVDQGIVESIAPNRFYIHFGEATLSVDQPTIDYGVQLYPNPSKAGEVFYITTGNLTDGPINVNVYDLLGKLVYTAKEQAENHKISVQTERPLSSGIYFVQISQKDQQVTKRLIIK